MNPIELKDPEGNVKAYMCSGCEEVYSNYEINKVQANNCCLCIECRAPVTEYSRCAKCTLEQEEKLKDHYQNVKNGDAKFKKLLSKNLKKTLDKDASISLRDFMSELSEDYYCAGWEMNLEYDLWGIINKDIPNSYGLGELKDDEITKLKDLNQKCGGWWIWYEDPDDKFNSGELFITTEEWLELYKDTKGLVF